MYRKTKKRSISENINLDSLMDILTCSVGVMLFVVIFAVIEARGVIVDRFTPLATDPPRNSERKMFICNDGRIRLFDISNSIEKLLDQRIKITFQNVPKIVRNANKKKITDGYFNYTLEFDEWSDSGYWNQSTHRSISVVVKERHDNQGETAEQIKDGDSNYQRILSELDGTRIWIAFSVDSVSLDIFREARGIALEMGYASGWDPGHIRFPHKEVIIGGGDRRRDENAPRPPYTGPQSWFKIRG